MTQYPGGWLTLESSNPIPITNYIAFAMLYDGAVSTDGIWESHIRDSFYKSLVD